jgi:hypothetical protein
MLKRIVMNKISKKKVEVRFTREELKLLCRKMLEEIMKTTAL